MYIIQWAHKVPPRRGSAFVIECSRDCRGAFVVECIIGSASGVFVVMFEDCFLCAVTPTLFWSFKFAFDRERYIFRD